jgi:hypothetical protein
LARFGHIDLATRLCRYRLIIEMPPRRVTPQDTGGPPSCLIPSRQCQPPNSSRPTTPRCATRALGRQPAVSRLVVPGSPMRRRRRAFGRREEFQVVFAGQLVAHFGHGTVDPLHALAFDGARGTFGASNSHGIEKFGIVDRRPNECGSVQYECGRVSPRSVASVCIPLLICGTSGTSRYRRASSSRLR